MKAKKALIIICCINHFKISTIQKYKITLYYDDFHRIYVVCLEKNNIKYFYFKDNVDMLLKGFLFKTLPLFGMNV